MVNVTSSVADCIYRLGFQNLSDAQATDAYCSESELYQFADDAAKRLSYQLGVFVTLDDSIAVTAGIASYNLQTNHVFTIFAWVAPLPSVGGSVQILRATPVNNLFALDDTWAFSSGEANRYSLDAGAVGTITLYPTPVNSGTLRQIAQEFPAAVAVGNAQLSLPSVLQDYFSMAMICAARGKESDQAIPEITDHIKHRLDLYGQVINQLYGPGQ